jgi:serine/threonine-protein kinase HipA
MRSLVAWIEDRRIGVFSETPQSDGSSLYAFDYDAVTELDIVSLTMIPTQTSLHFETRSFPSPFDMILPEGERRLRIEQARKILRTDAFSMLSYVGGDPVNRVRFLPPESLPLDEMIEIPAPAEIASTSEGLELFRALIERLDLRQGIAGVQPKILGLPEQSRKPSLDVRQFRGNTHILKASTERYPFLAANEATCLEIFRSAGLQVPQVTLSADGTLLLVERFDVRADGHCMGFEEAAALMGETSDTKYDRDYGSLINDVSRFLPAADEVLARCDLVRAVLLNHLIGNGDAHLKNFGVLYESSTDVRLAPLYDCVATLPYIPDDVPALALCYEWYSKAWWPREKIEMFAVDAAGLSFAAIGRMIEECTEAVRAGTTAISRRGRDIPGFADLATRIAELWEGRIASFAKEASILKRKVAKRKRP